MSQMQMINPMKEVSPIKNMLNRTIVSNVANTGKRWLNLNLSRRAPAISLDRQFITPLTPYIRRGLPSGYHIHTTVAIN